MASCCKLFDLVKIDRSCVDPYQAGLISGSWRKTAATCALKQRVLDGNPCSPRINVEPLPMYTPLSQVAMNVRLNTRRVEILRIFEKASSRPHDWPDDGDKL